MKVYVLLDVYEETEIISIHHSVEAAKNASNFTEWEEVEHKWSRESDPTLTEGAFRDASWLRMWIACYAEGSHGYRHIEEHEVR